MLRIVIFFNIFITILVDCANFQSTEKQFRQLKITSAFSLIQSILHTKELQESQISPDKKILEDVIKMQAFFDIKQADLSQQLKQYEQNYLNYVQTLNGQQKWSPDPQMSSSFQFNKNQQSQSLIFKGAQNSQMVTEITITQINSLLNYHQGVYIFVVNIWQLNQDIDRLSKQQKANSQIIKQTIKKNTEYKGTVKKHSFLVLPSFTSDLYEVLIIQLSSAVNYTQRHISVQMSIQSEQYSRTNVQNNQDLPTISAEEQVQIVTNMNIIVSQNDETFLDSLQLWQKIQEHRRQHEQTLMFTESVQLWECVGILILYSVEYLALRYITMPKPIV